MHFGFAEEIVDELIKLGLEQEKAEDVFKLYHAILTMVKRNGDTYITAEHIAYRIYWDFRSGRNPKDYIEELGIYYDASAAIAEGMRIPEIGKKKTELCYRCHQTFRYIGEACPNCGKAN